MDEAERVLAARKGDDRAFLELIERHKTRLYKMAYVHLENEPDALEAVQETTCRAYIHLKKLKEPQYFGSWLMRILINYCLDELKRRQKSMRRQEIARMAQMKESRGKMDQAGVPGSYGVSGPGGCQAGHPAEEILEQRLEQMVIHQAVRSLELKPRQVIYLKYFGDMTLREIAWMLDCPEGTVKTWLHKGLAQLRQALGGEAGEDAGR